MKKLLAMLLTLAMILGLVACGGSTTSASEPANSDVSETVEAPAEEETPAAPAEDAEEAPADNGSAAEEEAPVDNGGLITTDYTYELPLFEEGEYSFSMWVSFSDNMSSFMPNQYNDNKAYQKACELTGCDVELVNVSTEANSEQFSLRVASNDLPNVVTNVAQLWTSSWDSAIDDEVFIDLEEMLQYMPAYSECYDQLDEATKKDLHTDSGYMPKLISIDNWPDGATEGAFIRTDYLEKVGMEMPTTYDELDAVLRAFQSELGLAEPWMATSGIVHTSNALCSGYGVNGGFSVFPMVSEPYYVVDGEVKFGIVEEGFKEYMQMFATYYADGIISPDFISKNTNPMEFAGTIASGDVGVFFGETNMVPDYYSQGKSMDENFEIAPLAPITKTEGEATHFGTAKSPITGRLAGIAISTTDTDLEKLGKYLDFFFTYEGSLLSAMGIEGNEDGSYIFDEDGKLQYSDNWNNLEGITENNKPTLYVYSCMPMLCPETPSTYTMDVQFECADVWDSNADADYQMPSITMTAEESEDYNAIYSDIQTYISENLSKFAVGDKSMDEWDSFVEDIWGMDLQSCIDLKQGAVDRYYAR